VRFVLHSFMLGPLTMRLELRLSADFADVLPGARPGACPARHV